MALRPILSIPIDSSAFDAFVKKYEHYQKLLSGDPANWKKVSDGIGKSRSAFDALVSAQTASLARTKLIAEAQKEAERRTQTTADHWKRMADHAKSFSGSIFTATRSLLQWTALTGVFTGLLGGAGLFGLDRLAYAVSQGRRSSLGLGVTYGEQRAFGLNFGRLVNPDQYLSGVNEALHDVTKRIGLYGAGLTEQQLQGKDTAQVAVELLPALKRLADQTPESQMGQVLRARHLDQFISLEDFQRLRNTPAGELDQYQRQYGADTRQLQVKDQVQKAWQDLAVQLSRAGEKIENVFVTGLGRLADPINRLSDGFANLVKSLLGSDSVSHWLDQAAKGLEWLAKAIGTPEFEQGIKNAAQGVIDFGVAVGNVAKLITRLFGGGESGSASGNGDGHTSHMDWPSWLPNLDRNSPGYWFHKSSYSPGQFGGLEGRYNLPGGIVNAVWGAESGYGRDTSTSSAGAMGQFQFMPDTWRQYGGGDPNNLGTSSEHAAHYLSDLMAEFKGDVAQALAAYNWGPGNVERDIREHGNRWRDYLPAETQAYLAKILPQIGGRQGIYVYDKTGGSITVSTAQLAA